MKAVTVASVGMLTLSACGGNGDGAGGDQAENEYQACMVTDSGDVDDRSFNEAAWDGFLQSSYGNSSIHVDYLVSETHDDFLPNLEQSIANDCDIIFGIGGLIVEDLAEFAAEHPEQDFAIVDGNIDLDNVYSIEFDPSESSFLTGYAAAATSETGTVATWGGMPIGPVTIFMDGYVQGVEYYNEVKNESVDVLGWDPDAQEGTFIDSFEDVESGREVTENFVEEGADVVHSVAGTAGMGTIEVAKETGDVKVVWVDRDGCIALEDACDRILTSSVKNISAAVTKAIDRSYAGGGTDGSYLGDLSNEGVAMSEFHTFDTQVPDDLTIELDKIQSQIITGSLTIDSPARPEQ